jgi:hypothetical protein
MDSKSDDGDEIQAPPAAKAIDDGYSQTYLIMSRNLDENIAVFDSKADNFDADEVFFRCGNWCYKGLIQFGNLKVGVEDLPILIPTLQRQQGSLRYYCTAKK